MKNSPVGMLHGHGRGAFITSGTHLHRCPWCGRKKPTHFELYGVVGYDRAQRAYEIAYPTFGELKVAVVSHTHCGPDTGYAIEMDELEADPNGWYHHLKGKIWFGDWIREAIYDVLLLHRKDAYAKFQPRRPITRPPDATVH